MHYDIIERKDGTLALDTPSDPIAEGERKLGSRRYNVGFDLGGRGEDPSALVVLKSEAIPYLTGRGWEQNVTPPKHTVVYSSTARLAETTDAVDWVTSLLLKLDRKWTFAFDATGMGAPLASMFAQAKVPMTPVIMTAGASMRREGVRIYISKNLMLEEMATAFENGSLQIATNLPERDDLLREITSIEYQVTSAGNLTLQGGGKGHHADRAIATAIALVAAQHVGSQSIEVTRLRGAY